jgi:hypothetical protein
LVAVVSWLRPKRSKERAEQLTHPQCRQPSEFGIRIGEGGGVGLGTVEGMVKPVGLVPT